jgi:Cdc6-like AAA superfamily ATPase
MNLNRDANLNRIIRRVETRLSNRRRRDNRPISYYADYAETEMEKVVADYLDYVEETDSMKSELLRLVAFYVKKNYKEI